MEQITQNAIKAIAALEISNNQSLGDIHTPIYFKKDQYALFFNSENQTVELLISSKKNNQDSVIRFFYQLTELLSILKELEANHLIYVLPQESTEPCILYYQDKQDFVLTQVDSAISISPSLCLQCNPDGSHIIRRNKQQILNGNELPSIVFNDLRYFFNAIVFPTAGLHQYIKNNYCTFELYQVKKANKFSKIGIIIAIAVAVISPILSVFISNKYGVSTLNGKQYNELIQSVYFRDTLDSIKINKVYGR